MLGKLLKEVFGIVKGQASEQSYDIVREETSPFVREPDRPSVLVMTHSYHGNGAAEILMYVLRWLAIERGWQVHALADNLTSEDRKALDVNGVGLVDYADPDQYDFGIVNTVVSGPIYIQQIAARLPVIFWIHEGETVIWNSQWQVGDWKRVFSQASRIVFQTSWQAERIFGSFTSHLSSSHYCCISNCLLPIPDNIIPVSRATDKKRIVFIGSLYERKRPTDLMDAVLRLNRFDLECVFVGSKEHLSTFPERHRRLIQSDSRFVFTGAMDRRSALAWLCTADAFCLPSSDESQPLVLFEAAHYRVPIIISDLPVYRGNWMHGHNCLMHAVGDTATLAAHLERALSGDAPDPVLPTQADVSETTFRIQFDQLFHELLPSHHRSLLQPTCG